MLNCKFDSAPILDLGEIAKSNATSFHTGYLIPHGFQTRSQVQAIAALTAKREAQTLLDEATNKISAVNTKSVCTSHLQNEAAVIGSSANTTAVLQTIVSFDPTSLDPTKVPFLHYAARSIGLVLSSHEYVCYAEQRECNAAAIYNAFTLLDRVRATTSKIFHDEASISAAAALNGNTLAANVSANDHRLAWNSLEKGLDHFAAVVAGAEEIDESVAFRKSPYSDASKAAAAAVLAAAKRKLQTPATERDPKKLRESPNKLPIEGAIICTGSDKMDMPSTWPPGESELCAANLRHKSKGCRHPRCIRSHAPPAEWSTAMKSLMMSHVKATPNLSWNPAIATPAILGLAFNSTPEVP